MVAQTLAHFGHIDILVNNAGTILAAPFLDITEEQWDRVLNVNLKGLFLCCQAVAPHMMERRGGRIVNIASISGKRGSPRLAHYCASKFGVVGLTQVLALELAPYDITVNAVCPGLVRTYMWTHVLGPGRADLVGVPPGEVFDETVRRLTPLGREQTPEDIGQCVVYLCQADNVTGIAVDVAGGAEMR
jgi:NAD(P)-dependent dehydrogenase (short-subunit alcohol dehydrogenase family)